MISITQILTSLVSDAFEQSGYDRSLGQVAVADRPDLGQYQCNGAFAAAKQYRKAPAAIAGDVIAVLQKNDMLEDVSFAPPGFINLTLTTKALVEHGNSFAKDSGFAFPKRENEPTMMIDYGGANVAKPLHIGHLRSAIIGESLKRLGRVMGYKVIGDVHLGDWGLQMGLVIAELRERNPDWPCFAPGFDPETDPCPVLEVDALNEIYPFASAKSKEDEAFREKAKKATVDLQKGEPGHMAVWKEIMRVSVADLKINYGKLGVNFDLWYGESNATPYIDELLETLRAKDLLRESDGALVVDVEEESDKAHIPPVIIKKSDNSDIYATTDLATIIQRQKDYAPGKIWYLTDSRQALHFTQVFRCARKAGLVPPETELAFLGFGTMNGSDGKPYKTRDGGVMRLSDLLDTASTAALEKLKDSVYIQSLSLEEKEQLAQKVGIAAIKFGDLINYCQNDYIFNLDKFLSFEGKTGPYILYMLTRIHSILKKLEIPYTAEMPLTGVYSATEVDLLLKIFAMPDLFERAFREMAPNYICENAYVIASLFSKFYHDNHIMVEQDEEKKNAWIALILLVRKAILAHLDILGIEAVENM